MRLPWKLNKEQIVTIRVLNERGQSASQTAQPLNEAAADDVGIPALAVALNVMGPLPFRSTATP